MFLKIPESAPFLPIFLKIPYFIYSYDGTRRQNAVHDVYHAHLAYHWTAIPVMIMMVKSVLN
jgi:hypothetical protein